MTDLPPPYSPPPRVPEVYVPFGPMDPGLSAARRASTIMFILCGVLLALGAMAFAASTIPLDQVPPQQRPQLDQIVAQTGHPFKTVARAFGWTMIVPAIVLGVLGLFVRAGRRWAIWTALTVVGAMFFIMGGELLLSFTRHEIGISSGWIPVGLVALLAWLISLLFTAMKAARRARFTVKQQWSAVEDLDEYQ